MESTLSTFLDSTKKDCLLVGGGLMMIAIAYAMQVAHNSIAYYLVAAGGLMVVGYGGCHFTGELVSATPELNRIPAMRRNVIAAYAMSIMLAITVMYATYKLAF
jgi:hypothetical protein